MLAKLSTLLSRARRAKAALIFAEVHSLEVAVAVVRAAETQNAAIVLTVSSLVPLLSSLDLMVATLLTLGRAATTDVCIEVVTATHHVAVEQALAAGAQVVTPMQGASSTEQYQSLLGWLAPQAYLRGVEVVAYPSNPILFDDAGVVALRAGLFEDRRGGQVLSAERLVHLQKLHKIPLIATEAAYTPAQLRRLARAQIGGVVLSDDLEQAFTAGLRTALRDRQHYQIRQYLPKAQLAVEEKVVRYLSVLC